MKPSSIYCMLLVASVCGAAVPPDIVAGREDYQAVLAQSLATIAEKRQVWEKRENVISALPNKLNTLVSVLGAEKFSAKEQKQFIWLTESLVEWSNAHPAQTKDIQPDVRRCVEHVARLLGEANQQVVDEAISFWSRRIDHRDLDLEPYRETITDLLSKELTSWNAIKVFVFFPLPEAQKQIVRAVLKQDEQNSRVTIEQKWTVLARLGDPISREKLNRKFKEKIGQRSVYTDRKQFRELESLVALVGYSQREKCPRVLVDALSSPAQLVTINGNTSVRVSVLLALEKHFLASFAEIFQMRVTEWINRNAAPSIIEEHPTRLPECGDMAALREFETFCVKTFAMRPWKTEDVWFRFSRVIPRPPAGFRGKLSPPSMMQVESSLTLTPLMVSK